MTEPKVTEWSGIMSEPDFRLWSAAPDLYEALKQIAEGLANTGSTPGEYMTAMTKRDAAAIAHAALTKADGGAS